jgi:hypothetical protein
MKCSLRLASLGLALLVAAAAHGAIELEHLDGWPYAGAQAVAIDRERDLAFLSSGGAVLILDVSDPASPTLVYDGIHTNGHVLDLRYTPENYLLYVASYNGGLEVWDVTYPQEPAQIGSTLVYYLGTGNDQPTDNLFVSGDHVYINANLARVHGFDVSDPKHPADVGSQAGPSWIPPNYELDTDDVAVADGYAYVVGDGLAKFIINSDGTLDKVGEYLYSHIRCVEVQGAYAYTANYGALGVFDVSADWPQLEGSAASGGTLNDLAVSGQFVFGVNEDGLRVFDVSSPQQPQLIVPFSMPGGYRVRLDGDIAYVACDDDGLQVVDVSDPMNPVLIGGYDTVGSSWTVGIVDDLAYLGQGAEGLVMVDALDPNNMNVVGKYDENVIGDSLMVGEHMYITDWQTPALRVLDISDPANPSEVGSVEDFTPSSLATDGQYLYVMSFVVDTQLYHLHVFDLTDPTAPVELSSIPVSEHVVELEYSNGHVFALQLFDEGLHIISVEDPYDPHEVEFYPVNWGSDVWIDGDRAFVTSLHQGLLVLDIADPAHPSLLGLLNEVYVFDSVAVIGDLAFVTTGLSTGRGLRLYDVGDPSNIAELDRVDLPGEAWDIIARGSLAYIADGYTGLQIYRAGGAPADVNGDGDVDIDDLLLLLSAWGDCPDPPSGCAADLDGDGIVGVNDLLILLADWT